MADKAAIIRKIHEFDNPYLRHFIKEHALRDPEAVVLGTLIELTNQMQTAIKTTFSAISEMTSLSRIDVHQKIQALHRYRIIEAEPDGKYVLIRFHPLRETIDEIGLAYKNKHRIEEIAEYIDSLRHRDLVEKAELFDLIYPMLGELVAKKIATAMRSMILYINDRLDSAMSLRMWKYRVISRWKGIPMAELLMRDALPYWIDEAFVIHRETGLLIAHCRRREEGTVDRDMVAGMLTAINDFIRTSFEGKGKKGKPARHGALDEIVYGEDTIRIVSTATIFCAFVVHGHPDSEFLQKMESTTVDIHRRYYRKLKSFDGEMEKVSGIDEPIRRLITETSRVPDAKREKSLWKVKALGAAIALGCVVGAVWGAHRIYSDYKMEQRIRNRVFRKIKPYQASFDVSVSGDKAVLTGVASNVGVIDTIVDTVQGTAGMREVRSGIVVVDFSTLNDLRKAQRRLSESMLAMQVTMVRSELEKIIIRFPINEYRITKEQDFQLRRAYEILEAFPKIRIDIIAFTDNIGGFEVNKRLALKRMGSVRGRLIKFGMAADRISFFDFDPELLRHDPRLKKFRNERGLLLFARMPKKKS